jgi:hypothetical protein
VGWGLPPFLKENKKNAESGLHGLEVGMIRIWKWECGNGELVECGMPNWRVVKIATETHRRARTFLFKKHLAMIFTHLQGIDNAHRSSDGAYSIILRRCRSDKRTQ